MRTGWTPTAVPFGADQTVYLVVDGFWRGNECHEIEIERSDLETVIVELMAGQFNDPIRVFAFNTLEHWSKDLSNEIAKEIQIRSDVDGMPVPDHLREFVERHHAQAISVAA
ncbi:MAG: hypothetical protein HY852_20735 [Bradyrhizobium sp.]|uniref:hypothetical protein n=1 Tax=Bradyrhizobium sp. TaxID=376 RepID=UPI0025BCE6E3|nr:hypothetical protein [Bradyrhizobium sp.]MBI5264236.1 hypothetical protein [Bradyrhizobium sp.]